MLQILLEDGGLEGDDDGGVVLGDSDLISENTSLALLGDLEFVVQELLLQPQRKQQSSIQDHEREKCTDEEHEGIMVM